MPRRIAIIGGPNTGKTTLARTFGPHVSTDNFMDLGWSEASEFASLMFDRPGELVIEGVAVPRALRKWLRANPETYRRPVDRVIFLVDPYEDWSSGQERMAKGVRTVFDGIRGDLEERGVTVEERAREQT